jgi:hypothetical protein
VPAARATGDMDRVDDVLLFDELDGSAGAEAVAGDAQAV